MRRYKILCWHIHGSYLDALAQIDQDWYLPVTPDRGEGYGGRRPGMPPYVREVPAEEVRNLDLDIIICQTPKNFYEDIPAILSPEQQKLPKIYLEHNCPRQHPTDTKHPIDDPNVLLVHVTHFNNLMWDSGRTPTMVIEHSVAIDPSIEYVGDRDKGITVINEMKRRGRISGYDIFCKARESVPLDTCGIKSEEIGGLGDIKYRDLHRLMARYRFLFSPMRYTSLPLAVIEAMTIGMPMIALATTELPTVIQNDYNGYVSCDVEFLIDRMLFLLNNPKEAKRLGQNAKCTAQERFNLDRFRRDWNKAFDLVAGGL